MHLVLLKMKLGCGFVRQESEAKQIGLFEVGSTAKLPDRLSSALMIIIIINIIINIIVNIIETL